MLSTYNETCLLNESLAYHYSTNYFRNPLFETDGLSDLNGEENRQEQLESSDSVQLQQQQSIQASRGPTEVKGVETNNTVHSFIKRKRKKFSKFCDNVTLTFKGKLFVMELNFKRRLSSMRSYLDRRMPWIMPSYNKNIDNNRRHSASVDTISGHYDERQASPPKSSAYNWDELSVKNDSSPSLADFHGKSFWNNLKPPKSSECIGQQQEKILNRLARIKRISQKLFNSPNGLEDQTEGEVHQAISSINAFDLNRQLSFRGDQDCCAENWSESFPRQSSSDMFESAVPPSQTTIFKAARSDDSPNENALSANNKPSSRKDVTKASAPLLSTSTTKAGIKRRRRFLASGKRIKSAAIAFTLPSKKLCIVCYENSPNIVTLPCKHHDICSDCFIEIIYTAVKHSQYPLKCVLCRQKIEKIRCSRRLLLSVIEKNRTK